MDTRGIAGPLRRGTAARRTVGLATAREAASTEKFFDRRAARRLLMVRHPRFELPDRRV